MAAAKGVRCDETIDDLAISGKRVLVRADLNVRLGGGRSPTGGKPDSRYSLAPVAERLGELLGRPVPPIPRAFGACRGRGHASR
jgi:phosphoglycerate kinase